MFNQVAVPPEDEAALRFLWRQSPESEIEVYQYLQHIAGAKCAPTCSNYALLRTAEDNRQQYPVAVRAVMRNFYMEDFFKSVKTTDDALELQQQLGYRGRQTIEFLSRTGPQYYAGNLLKDR